MNNYYKPTREEQETHITFDAVTRLYHIWTAYPQHIKRCNKLGYQPAGRSDGIVFECYVPEHCIKFQPLNKPKRQLTEEQKQAQRERIQKMNAARMNQAQDYEHAAGVRSFKSPNETLRQL